MTQLVHCQNCGAPMVPHADGRTYKCEHCDAALQVAIDSDQIAAGLRLDFQNMDVFIAQLFRALRIAFAERVRVQHDGGRLAMVEVAFEKDAFVVRRDGVGLVTQHKKLVRGVALKTTPHPVDVWIGLLTKAIAAHANENARVAQVLAHLEVK